MVPSTVKLLYLENKWGSRGLQAWPETGSWWELVRNRAGKGTSGIDNFAWQHNWQNEHEAWKQVPSRMLTLWESRLCSLKGSRFGPLRVRFGQLLTYNNKAKGWTVPFRNGSWQCWKGCRESETPCLHGVSCASVDWNPYSSIGFARQCGCSTIPWLNWISSYPMKKVLHADMQLYMIQWLLAHAPMIAGPWSNDCWSNGCWPMVSPYLSAIDGLTQLYTFKQNLQNCEPIDLSRFVVDLRERHMEYWTPHSGTHPREHNSKRPTYHQRCALPEGIWSLIRLISYPNTCFSTCLVMSFAVQLVSDFEFTPYVLRQRLKSK